MSGCMSCLLTKCPRRPIVLGPDVRVYELSRDQMSKGTSCQGVRDVMGVRIVMSPLISLKSITLCILSFALTER